MGRNSLLTACDDYRNQTECVPDMVTNDWNTLIKVTRLCLKAYTNNGTISAHDVIRLQP